MAKDRRKLGEILLGAGLIDDLQLASALAQQQQWGGKLGTKFVEMGFVDENALALVLAKQFGLKFVIIDKVQVPAPAVDALKPDVAKKYQVMPFQFDENTITLAIPDPTDFKPLEELGFMFGQKLKLVVATEGDIKRAISKYYDAPEEEPSVGKASMPETEAATDAEPSSPPAASPQSNGNSGGMEISQKAVLETLVNMLIEQGVISKEDLMARLKKK